MRANGGSPSASFLSRKQGLEIALVEQGGFSTIDPAIDTTQQINLSMIIHILLRSGLVLGMATAATTLPALAESAPSPRPFKVAARLPDAAQTISPGAVQLEGWLGNRVGKNGQERLAKVDLEPLLAGFRKKPGVHPWIGEHIGKWMHAATLAWAYSQDDELRRKLDSAAAELIKAQEPDGYLGTYLPAQRFGLFPNADWDVWSHKYCLMGLLTYYQYTGSQPALEASRKAGNLLLATFGSGKKSLLSAGTHVGMAATSVLEPMVLLYRFTGDDRYLGFCESIVKSWDEPGGPRIIKALLETRQVNKTANAKAYEMLSNLVGLCELARVTGDRKLLEPVLIAWEDIVGKRLYLTGSASQGEHFKEDYFLPSESSAHVAETCVTTTWIQLNSQLLRSTGHARYGNELERTFYNHLSAAQRPDGREWCYFTALEGTKPYGPGINCCVSSGPRGMALVPPHAFLVIPGKEGASECLAINLFEALKATIQLGGKAVEIRQHPVRLGPDESGLQVSLAVADSARFGLAVRQPAWATGMKIKSAQGETLTAAARDGWLTLPDREWKETTSITITFTVGCGLVAGTHGNLNRAALTWGPFVLAYDEKQNPGQERAIMAAFASPAGGPAVDLVAIDPAVKFEAMIRSLRNPQPHRVVFVPFADAGGDGGRYRVWLPGPNATLRKDFALTLGATEDRSRRGNLDGSINDGDPATAVVTFDGSRQPEDWFAVQLDEPIEIRRVVFMHGKTFHDGGWFDASAGKPRIQIKKEKGLAWENLDQLSEYPSTTATDSKGLREGQAFTCRLPGAMKIVALRVIGKPACGDNPSQAFSSCAELEAFGE